MSADDGVDALLREFPALAREGDGRVKCTLTGHVMAARQEAIAPYVRGKKFAAALARRRDLDSLKQFAPHIVPAKYAPGKLFCRITGRYVQAKEAAVVMHSAGKRFEKGVEMLTSGDSGAKLLTERPPEEVAAEREREAKERAAAEKRKKKAQAAALEAAAEAKQLAKKKRREEKAAAAAASGGGGGVGGGGGGREALDPTAAAKERLRVNGGFSEEHGCWVPPAHVIDTDDDDDSEDDEDGDETSSSEEDASDDDGSEDADEDADDDSDDAEDSDDEVLMPTVRAPNFAKIAARRKQRDVAKEEREGKKQRK